MNVRFCRLAAGAMLAVAVAACSSGATAAPTSSLPATSAAPGGLPFAIKTAPVPVNVCDEALMTGTLVKSPQSGLGLADPAGKVTPVLWPFGYSARVGLLGIELLDNAGAVVAHEKEIVQSAGGSDGQGVFRACSGTVHVVAPVR